MSDNLGFVILSYNHPELTAKCVENTLLVVPPERVLLFHNGSQPRFVAQLKEKFPQIRHREIVLNRGFSGGANQSLSEAFREWEWAFFLTNDTKLMAVGRTPESPGLYAPLIWQRKLFDWDSWGAKLNLLSAKLTHIKQEVFKLKNHECFYVPGTAFLLDRKTFTASGGFDERLGTFWEDVDFSLRCQKLGLVVKRTAEFTLSHAGGKTCHKDESYTLYLFQRNRWIVSFRFASFWQRCCLIFSWAWALAKLSRQLLFKRRFKSLLTLFKAYSLQPLRRL